MINNITVQLSNIKKADFFFFGLLEITVTEHRNYKASRYV